MTIHCKSGHELNARTRRCRKSCTGSQTRSAITGRCLGKKTTAKKASSPLPSSPSSSSSIKKTKSVKHYLSHDYRKNKHHLRGQLLAKQRNLKKQQPMTMRQIHIQFMVPYNNIYRIENNEKHPIKRSTELVALMNKPYTIKSNGLKLEDGAYISDMLGTFKLDQCVFTPKDKQFSGKRFHVDIKLHLNLKNPELTYDQVKEAIWTILPAVYSTEYDYEYDYTFKKYDINKTTHFGVQFTDGPENLKFEFV